jgi:hypothetical protein
MPAIEPAFSVNVASGDTDPRRHALTLLALALAVMAGGCASQSVQNDVPLFVGGDAPIAATGRPWAQPSADPAASDWRRQTYVYRGGRDPSTGLAYIQM